MDGVPQATTATGWPLIGRQVEQRLIADTLDRGDANGVVLVGPAGVGKTRLASECARDAQARGVHTARVLATRAAAAIPFGALAPLLPARHDRAELRGDLLRWAADAIEAVAPAGDRPLLVVDDAQWLDDASATVVQHLVQSNAAFVVATVRAGEPAPDAVQALWKEGLARRIELQPLTSEQVDELLRVVLDGPVDGGSRRDLWNASRGNALYLRELVVGAIDAGVLQRHSGVWRLGGALSSTPRLVELIEARLVDLDEGARQLLELLAIGEPLGLGLLEQLAPGTDVEMLERRGLVEVAPEARRREVRLGHPLYGDVLRATMPKIRTLGLNRQLADSLSEKGTRRREDILRVAVFRLEGGGHADPDLMVEASRRAFFAHDDDLAERLARHAISEGGGVRAGLLLAQVLGEMGRQEERVATVSEAAGLAKSDEERALVAMEHSLALFWGLGQAGAARAALANAEAELPAGPWRDELTAQRATFALLTADFAEGLELVRPILERNDGDRATVNAAIAAAPAIAIAGRCEEAISLAERGLTAHIALGDQEVFAHPGIHVAARVLAMGEAGRLYEAIETARTAYEFSVAHRMKAGQAWFSMMLGRAFLATGELAGAERWFSEGSVVFGALAQVGPRRWCVAGRMLATAMRGDVTGAVAARAELESAAETPMMMMEPDVLRARSWVALVDGNEEEAARLLVESASLAESTGALALALASWHDLARIGRAVEAHEHLTRVAPSVEGALAPLRAAHGIALAANDVDSLVEVADGFEAAGTMLFAAEAVAAASAGARRHQQARAAQALTRRAGELAARCEGAKTPALALAGAGGTLTGRERDIAARAAQGLASKTIAHDLGLSVRTIDNHLQRAYEKLGVSNRADLAEALRSSE